MALRAKRLPSSDRMASCLGGMLQWKAEPPAGFEAPMPAGGQAGQGCFHSTGGAAANFNTRTLLERYFGYTYATYTVHEQQLVPRHANRPPAISLRMDHLFRIRGLAQSG